jgi:hypothetical protein
MARRLSKSASVIPALRFDRLIGSARRMLEVLPPAVMARGGFLVGEPWDHHALTGRPRYAAFVELGGRWFESTRPVTVAEFRSPGLPLPALSEKAKAG